MSLWGAGGSVRSPRSILSSKHLEEVRKISKYAGLVHAYIFIPVVLKTVGTWDGEASALVSGIGRQHCGVSNDPRSTQFLRQRIGIAL